MGAGRNIVAPLGGRGQRDGLPVDYNRDPPSVPQIRQLAPQLVILGLELAQALLLAFHISRHAANATVVPLAKHAQPPPSLPHLCG
jgi:hypothetical protein